METEWSNDQELFQLVREELFTSVIGDILDEQGYLQQFLPPEIRPLRNDMKIVGRAMTVLEADCVAGEASGNNPVQDRSFGLMLEALDDLRKGEVYLCSGSTANYALWGELMSARAIALGAHGAVVNGYSRDTDGILELDFPTFSYGSYGQDQAPRGKVIDFRCPILIGSVLVNPGDLLIGDRDGVCVVPKFLIASVVPAALEKARGEKTVQQKIKEGMSARQAFDQYGIL